MIKVIEKLKEGNKVTYKCIHEVTNNIIMCTKEQLINEINNNNVYNARIQNYKGQLIIRLKEDIKTVDSSGNEKKTRERKQNKHKQKTVYAIDLFKSIMREFGIKQEELALSVGFDNYDLEEDITNSGIAYIDKLSYQMASDIKKIADMENNKILMNYRSKYIERNNI